MRVHGGDRSVRLDFSVNVNPLGPPEVVYTALKECVGKDVIRFYPDYNYRELRERLANFYKCDAEHIIPTNGAAEALNLTVIALRPEKLVVIQPSYGEYLSLAEVLNINYADIYYRKVNTSFYLDLSDLNEYCSDDKSLVVVTNPNNPTGYYIDVEKLLSKLSECRARILLDEAYVELCDMCPIDVGDHIPENFIVVRSLTKWLSIPGLRAGFMYVPSRQLLERVNTLRQPWNVNSITECVLINVLTQEHILKDFIRESRHYLTSERLRVVKLLRDMGLTVYDSVTNFILIYLSISDSNISSILRGRGIAVRSCRDFKGLGPNYIRVSIRRTYENDELIKALNQALKYGLQGIN